MIMLDGGAIGNCNRLRGAMMPCKNGPYALHPDNGYRLEGGYPNEHFPHAFVSQPLSEDEITRVSDDVLSGVGTERDMNDMTKDQK